MADLGSLAALLLDIAAKVTTNANNENTGARVRACLVNIADTVNGLIGTAVAGEATIRQGADDILAAGIGDLIDNKQNRTRNIITLTAISNTHNLNGTEDLILATGVSPTAVFDPAGTLPLVFCLEIRNDSSQNVAFNPFSGTIISVLPGGSAILRQITAGVWVDLLAAKANTESPTFTGTPAAPTPSAADNTTKIATTAFVQGELAAKAPLASPTFTGTPAAPTAAAATNTTQLATTAFVRQEISALGTVSTFTSGAALQFDVPRQYNTRATPSSATVTLSLTGAVAGTTALCYFNHGAEPTWPSGVTVGGNGWVNSGVNEVLFIYSSGGVVSGTNVSSNTSYVNPEVVKKPTAGDQATTKTTAVAITGMSFTAAANTDYALDIVLQVTGTATGGVCLGLYSSVGTDQTFALSGLTNNATAGNISPFATTHATALNTINTANKGSASASTNGYIYLRGKLRGGAASSTIDLRFASFLSGQTATVFALGSFMKATTC